MVLQEIVVGKCLRTNAPLLVLGFSWLIVSHAKRHAASLKLFLFAVLFCGLGVHCDRATAQTTDPNDNALAPIVVTAQRRPERAEDVPIFLTVASGEQLERAQATNTADLGKIVPSLIMTRTGSFTQPYLRGVGKRSTLGVENSVATYVDGVYLASSISALLDLHGIDRVEILNGPQGTLFGRNATGGVIQVVTREPNQESSAEIELHTGTYGYVRGDAYLSGGTDRLAGNLAVSASHNGGYGSNLYTGKTDQGEVHHSFVARSKWIWRPTEPVKLTVAADYQDVDQDFSYRPVAGYPPIGQPRVQGFRDGDQDGANRYRFRYGGVSANAQVELGGITFMSLTAVRSLHSRHSTDQDQGPSLLLFAFPTAQQRQFSQEFQLQSGERSRVRWVAGLYYIRIDERYEPYVFEYGGSYSARLGGRVRQTLYDSGRVSSHAAYGQALFPIAEHMRLTAGVRYTIEDRRVQAQGEQLYDNPPYVRPIPGLPLLTQEPLRNSVTFQKLTWRASLDRNISDTLMGYLSASRGFQSGGWNLQTPQNPAFGPETLDAFEGGLKYAERTGRLTADVSVFYYDYRDLQVSSYTPLGAVTTNATSADIYGLELQLEAQLDPKTGITFGGQVLNARFKHFPNATCVNFSASAPVPYSPVSCDVTGNRLPFAPTLKFSASVHHAISLGHIGALLVSGNLAYNSGYFSEADNVVRQTAFVTIDGAVEWRPPSHGPTVRIWATNLLNSRYYDSLVTFPTAGVLQKPAAPRRLGISVGYTF